MSTTGLISNTEEHVIADATGGAIIMTLPSAVGRDGFIYRIKKVDVSANTVTVACAAAETIDESATHVLSAQYEAITAVSDNSNWWII